MEERHPFATIKRVGTKWYHFDLTFRINLKAMLRLAILLAILAAFIFAGYWLVKGAIALGSLTWDGICWLGGQWLWLLGAALLALFIWALSKVNWKNVKVGKNVWKYILWILALYHFRFAIFLYSSGSKPVLLRNSSANRLDVEYPIV